MFGRHSQHSIDHDVRHRTGVKQVAQRSCGCLIPRDVYDVKGPRHPDILCDSPVHTKGFGIGWSLRSFQHKSLKNPTVIVNLFQHRILFAQVFPDHLHFTKGTPVLHQHFPPVSGT